MWFFVCFIHRDVCDVLKTKLASLKENQGSVHLLQELLEFRQKAFATGQVVVITVQ